MRLELIRVGLLVKLANHYTTKGAFSSITGASQLDCYAKHISKIIRYNSRQHFPWFGWVLWHINHGRLFNAKSSLYICIKYIWFGLVGFYGKSTLEGYLKQNIFINIHYIYMIWFGWFLWHIYHCRLFKTKSFLYIYIKYIWFKLFGFYGKSTLVGYIMLNLFL